MQHFPVPTLPSAPRIRQRTALVTSADRNFRQRLTHTLAGLRWNVREAEGGAEAWAEAETVPLEAVIVDSWLPDLDLGEFIHDFHGSFPNVDILTADGARSARCSAGTLSAGTALRHAPEPGHRYRRMEHCSRCWRISATPSRAWHVRSGSIDSRET